jgi:hypothetical protein
MLLTESRYARLLQRNCYYNLEVRPYFRLRYIKSYYIL